LCEKRGRDVNFPAILLDFDDTADDEVTDLGRIASAEGKDGEELVGFEDIASEGRGYRRMEGGVVSAVAAAELTTLVFSVRNRVAREGGVPHPLGFICDLFAGYNGAIRGELHAF
jgi:hypothetical protein